MEFFAKSKERVFSQKEKEKIHSSIYNVLSIWEDSLEEWERNVLIKTIDSSDGIVKKQKTLNEHQAEIVQCAEKFFETYGEYFSAKEKVLIIEACKMHDWGKANLIFQILVNSQLRDNVPSTLLKIVQIPHGFLSALSISKKEFFSDFPEMGQEDFKAFITAIYYHHTRKDDYDVSEIKAYSERYYENYIKEYLKHPEWKLHVANRNKLLFRNDNTAINFCGKERQWNQYLLIKGMLNKFDYTVSAGYEEAELHTDLTEKRLVKSIESRIGNSNLRPAQTFMQSHPKENLVIIAPTGSGKTEAALLWLNGEKGFYTLPLKVSSNAIYNRIKEGYAYKNVSLLHSDSMTRYLQESADMGSNGYENYERAKLLSQPLTVCTVDQLFKFVYKALGTEIFPATLKYSKVILDEIQAYSPQVIAAIIYGLKTIHELGGRFAIITATFPPVLRYFMKQYGMIEGEEYLFEDFSKESTILRHKVQIRCEFNIEEIVQKGEKYKVLVICNTVKKTQELYEQIIKDTEEVYILHSKFIRRDREFLEKRIMDFSTDSEAVGIWITTQIVEASLDIDFDILYTEMCTADSLLQRMGRCNRKGRYIPEQANIIVIDDKNGVGKKSVYEPCLYERSLVYLGQYENVLFSETQKIEYINAVFAVDEIKDSAYFKKINKYLEHFDIVNPLDYDKKEADQEFRNIQSIAVIPDSIYEEEYLIFEKSRELLEIPYMYREVKSVLNSKLNSLTLSMNLYNGKCPEGVDGSTIDNTMIHRCRLQYEFDKSKGQGRGLLTELLEDEDYFL